MASRFSQRCAVVMSRFTYAAISFHESREGSAGLSEGSGTDGSRDGNAEGSTMGRSFSPLRTVQMQLPDSNRGPNAAQIGRIRPRAIVAARCSLLPSLADGMFAAQLRRGGGS